MIISCFKISHFYDKIKNKRFTVTCKVMCSLAYVVGCRCPPPPVEQYPSQTLSHLGWEPYILTNVVINAKSIESYYLKQNEYASGQAFPCKDGKSWIYYRRYSYFV